MPLQNSLAAVNAGTAMDLVDSPSATAQASLKTGLGMVDLAQQAVRTTAAKATTSVAAANLFTVSGGPVRVLSLVGLITTVIETKANSVKLTHTPTGGAAVDLCSVLNVTAAAVRTLLALDGVAATALVNTAAEGVVIASALHMPIILTPGTIALAATASSTGAVSWYIEFEPLAPGATVAAV